MWCDACRSIGTIHCAHPNECGNMKSNTALADEWKAWLDDLPLPDTFDPAIGSLQEFITRLTVLPPAQPALADWSAELVEMLNRAVNGPWLDGDLTRAQTLLAAVKRGATP